MSTVSYRSLKTREKSELRGYISPWITAFRAVLFLLAGGIIGAVLYWLEAALLPSSWPRLLWVLPTALLLGWLYAHSGRWTGGAEFRRNVRKDLDEGMARRLHVTVASATEFEEVGDTGPTFVITTPSGETMMFGGQEFLRRRAKGFPWREFEVFDAPHSHVFFALNRLGDAFKEVSRRAPLTYEQAKALGCFQKSFAFLPADWERML